MSWKHRSERYGEKLATPDTTVGDLIGDIDPIKVAEGRTLGDPETVHYGLVPRTNRGIFGVNELPDLAERIQVALLNVLEERDIQVRGYTLRLPLDLLLVASANPEDYTNRGRIITPLKDRFGAEVRTHYPLRLADELALIRQEASCLAGRAARRPRWCPSTSSRCVARFTRPSARRRRSTSARASRPGSRSPPSRRSRPRPCAGPRSPARTPPSRGSSTCRSIVPATRGKVEFDEARRGSRGRGAQHLLRRATAETFRARLAGLDLSGCSTASTRAAPSRPASSFRGSALLRQLGTVPGLAAAHSAGSASDGVASLRRWRQPRSSSRWRGCT